MAKQRRRFAGVAAGFVALLALLALSKRSEPERPRATQVSTSIPAALSPEQAPRSAGPMPAVRRVPTPIEPPRSEPAALLRAIPADAPNLVVLDTGALISLPVGRMIMRCLQGTGSVPARNLTTTTRLAIAQGADGRRLSIASGGDVASTQSEKQTGDERVARRGAAHGATPATSSVTMRRHGDLTLRGDAETVQSALHRLQTRGDELPGVDPNDDYSDAHGRLSAEVVGKLLPPDLADEVRRAGARFEFHLDASDGIQLTVDALGAPSARKTLIAALSRALTTMREHAQGTGDVAVERLLESASLSESADGFRLETTLPLDLVAALLGPCAAGGEAADDDG